MHSRAAEDDPDTAARRRPSGGQPLELQPCNGSRAQRFVTDGDAILMRTQAAGRVSREYVIEPEHGRTANRTPLVVGSRNLSDAEYFRFQAVDQSDRWPLPASYPLRTTPR